MQKLRKGIALRIGAFVGVLVLIISAALGILAYYRGSSAVIKQVEQALIMQVEEAVEYLETRFQVQLTALQTIAARPEISSMDWTVQRPVLQSEVDRVGLYLALGVVDLTGQARYTDGTTANLSDRDYVLSALAGKPAISDLLVSRVDNSLVLMYAVPIADNGKIVGALIGRRDGTALTEITDRLGFGERGWAIILNSDGTLFAHPNRQYVLDQRNLFTDQANLAEAGAAIKKLGVGNTGVVRYNLDGTHRIVGFAPAKSTGWMIGVGAMEADVMGDVRDLRIFFALAASACLVVGVLGAVLLARQIAQPLQRVQDVIEAASLGDLTLSAEVSSKDEIGSVAQAVNRTMNNMKEMLGLITSSTANLVQTSERLAATAQEVSASVEEVASTTNAFSATLDTMNRSAQEVNEAVHGVSRQAASGTEAIANMVRQMQTLRGNTQSLARDVADLGALSGEIGNIVNTIGAIAEQTNLLALNAAIEAARAGEHGRGFAVVAEEVRKLAEEASAATKSIEQLIRQIQSGIAAIVRGMNDGSTQAETALENVNQSSEILGSILRAVEEIQREVKAFTGGLDQINSGGHEIASATEEQAASMQEVANSAQVLQTMGARLKELVEQFKISDE